MLFLAQSETGLAYLGVDSVRVRLEWRLDTACFQPAPVNRIEPGVDLNLSHSSST